MSLKDTKYMEETKAKLEEARAELERLSAVNADQASVIMSMKTEIQRLNEENGKLNRENAMLDSENVDLVKSLERKCLEMLKVKNTPKVVTAPSMIKPAIPITTSTSPTVSVPVKRASKMSFIDANPALKKELRWEYFWSFIDKWLFPVSVVAVILYALWRCFV